MLAKGRLDAIVYAEDIARFQFARAGIDPAQYETVFVLKNSHMGYAFHNSTDPRTLEPLRKALDKRRAEGTVDRIYATYMRGMATKSSERDE
jgi:polar amino acid transport system substrate-binding protein